MPPLGGCSFPARYLKIKRQTGDLSREEIAGRETESGLRGAAQKTKRRIEK